MTVPYAFANASVSLPLSQLDSNFNTPIIIGNTAVQLGNTITTLNNMTLANVTISSTYTPITAGQGGTGLTAPGTAGNVLTSTGSGWVSSVVSSGSSNAAPNTASYVLISSNANLTSGRVLTAGANVTITDNGPGNTIVINSSGGGNGGGGVSSISFGSTGLTPSTDTTGNVTVSGTLAVGSGGTGRSSLTANSVMLGNGSSSVQFVAPGNSGNVLTSNGTVWLSSVATSSGITSGTVKTAPFAVPQYAEFTGIPSSVKRITVMFKGVTTSGSSNVRVRIGPSGGVETSGYLGASLTCLGVGVNTISFTAGFDLYDGVSAAAVRNGSFVLTLLDSATNTWTATANFGQSDEGRFIGLGGAKPLAGTLSIVRITTINGTDTFDAGSINILYE